MKEKQHLRYKLQEGGSVSGSSYIEIVDALMKMSFNTYKNRDEYIFETEKVFEIYDGSKVDVYNEERFVLSLVRIGYLIPENKKDGPPGPSKPHSPNEETKED